MQHQKQLLHHKLKTKPKEKEKQHKNRTQEKPSSLLENLHAASI
jgi:hypothetical protein